MSNPSRFDKAELLSATGGWFFRQECLRPHLNIHQCEVRTRDEKQPFLPNTKVLLLLGKDAFTQLTGDAEHTLGEVRGSIYYVNNIPAIPSYLPQDCMDVKDYESEFNELLSRKDYDEDVGESDVMAEKRRHGRTARTNWRFWLQRDTEKAIRILMNDGHVPSPSFQPQYRFYPTAKEVIADLESKQGLDFFFDIETDRNFGLKCIGYSFSDSNVVTVFPVADYKYQWAYPELPEVMRAFVVAATRNRQISHNGSGFDWPVLMHRYGLPLGYDYYDTMLAQHRCYPDIEKSLGHCTSLWTYEPFHKDEGSMQYGNFDDMRKLWSYCGKDVYTMRLIKEGIENFAKTIPGMQDSINQVNESVPVYLLMLLQGIHYKQEKLDAIMLENDGLMNQYNRIIQLLIGDATTNILNRKSKKSMANSNAKCCAYFHDMLGYPVVMRSKKTKQPSLGKKALYKLRLKHDNPVIDFCMDYRAVAKESGSLKFTPWNEFTTKYNLV